MRQVKPLNREISLFEPDGRLTLAGQKAFQDWFNALREARDELTSQDARITALEP